jgi:hypothetical protein
MASCGGWNCAHALIPVPESEVPKEVRERVERELKTVKDLKTLKPAKTAEQKADIQRRWEERREDKAVLGLFPEGERLGKKEMGQQWEDSVVEYGKKKGLTEAERVAATEYTRSTNEKINKTFYDKTPQTPQQKSFINTLNRALDKLDKYEGTVYRGINLKEGVIANVMSVYKQAFENKTTVIEPAFMSTSRTKDNDYYPNTQVKYTVNSKNGRNIEPLSKYQGKAGLSSEQEVLFKTSSEFNVTGFKEIKNKYNTEYEIYLEEV